MWGLNQLDFTLIALVLVLIYQHIRLRRMRKFVEATVAASAEALRIKQVDYHNQLHRIEGRIKGFFHGSDSERQKYRNQFIQEMQALEEKMVKEFADGLEKRYNEQLDEAVKVLGHYKSALKNRRRRVPKDKKGKIWRGIDDE